MDQLQGTGPKQHSIRAHRDAISLGESFSTQPNALNLIRLVLAATVIVWHAHLLPQRAELSPAVSQVLEQFPVDGFFALSGFLITRSWLRHSNLKYFILARLSRLFPGLWICLLFTAFLVVPVATALDGGMIPALASQADYVLGNATTIFWDDHRTIEQTTAGLARSPWNLSLWSLRWELFCYGLIAVLGTLGLLRPRIVIVLAGICWALGVSLFLLDIPDDFVFGIFALPRLLMMFLVGAAFWMYAYDIRMKRSFSYASCAVLGIAALTPDYRLLAAPAVAYLLLSLGLHLGRVPRLLLRNDLSYGIYIYGAPVQQAMLVIGFTGTWLTFTIASMLVVVPLAALSWFMIERPFLRRSKPRKIEVRDQPAASLLA